MISLYVLQHKSKDTDKPVKFQTDVQSLYKNLWNCLLCKVFVHFEVQTTFVFLHFQVWIIGSISYINHSLIFSIKFFRPFVHKFMKLFALQYGVFIHFEVWTISSFSNMNYSFNFKYKSLFNFQVQIFPSFSIFVFIDKYMKLFALHYKVFIHFAVWITPSFKQNYSSICSMPSSNRLTSIICYTNKLHLCSNLYFNFYPCTSSGNSSVIKISKNT